MTQKAEVAVSLGEEPIGQGIDDAEEPEKVWDLGPGEYVVNRGTRLDKTRMYVMDFEPSTTREGGVVLRTINPGIVDEYGNNVRLAEVVVSGGPDGKWREHKPQMEGMEGVVGSSMMAGGAGAMGGVDGGSNRGDSSPLRVDRLDRRGGAVVIIQKVETDTPTARLLKLEGIRVVCGKFGVADKIVLPQLVCNLLQIPCSYLIALAHSLLICNILRYKHLFIRQMLKNLDTYLSRGTTKHKNAAQKFP